jgi:uncharacterized membrane protein
MATHHIRTEERDSLARFLGWFSIGLGVAEVAAPRAIRKVIGGGSPRFIRLMGLRELGHGTGILTGTRPTNAVWLRVGGDALDALALAVVARHGKKRTLLALAQLAPIAAADAYEARHLSARTGRPQPAKRIAKAVTIAKPVHEVEQAWTEATDLRNKVDRHRASVTFREATGGRGTELAVEFVSNPRAGEFAVLFRKLTARDLATQLADDLRRFKSLVESGQVVRSDSTPNGHLLADHLRQRAAQPLEEVPA